MRNLILTGFMGTGKSTVGKILAERLVFRYCDLDAQIVAETGLTINEIFSRYGEEHFRSLETDRIRSLANSVGFVVSTGGGAVIAAINRRLLHEAGIVINLTASTGAILDRLRGECERPLFQRNRSPEALAAMLAEREPFYADADLRIDTTGKTVEDVVAEILRFIEGR